MQLFRVKGVVNIDGCAEKCVLQVGSRDCYRTVSHIWMVSSHVRCPWQAVGDVFDCGPSCERWRDDEVRQTKVLCALCAATKAPD
jgi:hypothetical protein